MTHRTVVSAGYDDYLESAYPATASGAAAARAADVQERQLRLVSLPHSVLLKLSFAELDFANRWCWGRFGPADGPCLQAQSEYPACDLPQPHLHTGTWVSHWLAKTDYNFGYNEWYFAQQADCEQFRQFVPQINWGERFRA